MRRAVVEQDERMTQLMSKEQTSIGPWLFWSIMVMTNFGYGYLNSTVYACKTMGANGYLAVLLAAPVIFCGLIPIYYLMKRYPEQNLIEQGFSIMGSICGRVTGFLYVLFLLAFLAVFNRDALNVIHIYLLGNTPLKAMGVAALLLAAYLGSRGIETISRLASFIILPFMAVLIFLVISVFLEFDVNHILPVFDLNLNLAGTEGLSILNIFYPMGLFAVITPYLRGIHAKIPRMVLLAFAVLTSVSLIVSIGLIGVFGHEYLQHFAYPALEVVRLIELPYLLLEQAGLFWIVLLFPNITIGSGFLFYIIGLSTSQVLGVWDYKRFVWVAVPVVFFLMLAIRNVTETKYWAFLIAQYGWIPLFAYPFFLYLLARIFRKQGEDAHGS
jgi:spore germination protein (amino acid permease)